MSYQDEIRQAVGALSSAAAAEDLREQQVEALKRAVEKIAADIAKALKASREKIVDVPIESHDERALEFLHHGIPFKLGMEWVELRLQEMGFRVIGESGLVPSPSGISNATFESFTFHLTK